MTDIPPDPPPLDPPPANYPIFRVTGAYAEQIRAGEAKGSLCGPLTARQVIQAQRRLSHLYSEPHDPNEDDHGGRLMSFLGAAIVAVAVLYAFVG